MTIELNHILLGSVLAGSPLLIIEIISRKKTIDPEVSRKLTHVGASLAAVLLTLFCSLHEITVLGLLFFVIFIISRRKQVWHSIYGINRNTWGEVMFPLGLAIAALIAPNYHTFILAMLFLGLSDTAANMVGLRYGKRHLPVFKHKTWVGSLACFATCYLIGAIVAGQVLSIQVAGLAVIVTIAEAAGSLGFDNLLIPVVAVAFIKLFGL